MGPGLLSAWSHWKEGRLCIGQMRTRRSDPGGPGAFCTQLEEAGTSERSRRNLKPAQGSDLQGPPDRKQRSQAQDQDPRPCLQPPRPTASEASVPARAEPPVVWQCCQLLAEEKPGFPFSRCAKRGFPHPGWGRALATLVPTCAGALGSS